MNTREQLYAQRAWKAVHDHLSNDGEKAERTFAKNFGPLVMSCGLCQALAFAQGKDHSKYLEALGCVLEKDCKQLQQDARTLSLPEYQLLTRQTLAAATWIKRYCEAIDPESNPDPQGGET